ncbi:MAG: hypothetical protein GEU93_14735 [Propionibacteriales bacterium]|nr:hypothetical protein [Propionibacteriales bacterium]
MFDSLTPAELVQAMSNTLRKTVSSTGSAGSEFDQVQCLSGASIGRYLAQELAHARELTDWFRSRIDRALAEAASGGDDKDEDLCRDLARRIRPAVEINDMGDAIADFLRDLDNLPDTGQRRRAESLLHGCLRDLADRQVLMLLGEYPPEPDADDTDENPRN